MLLTAITFFLILSILVFAHEFGHYLAARLIGVGVEEFGFGLPPRLFGKKIKGTIYSLNLLPIGGFVKLSGEDDSDLKGQGTMRRGQKKQYFWARTKKERAIILLAGVTMNFLLSVGITSFLLTRGIFEPTDRVRIEKVVVFSPASIIGLKVDDIVSSITTLDKGQKQIIAIHDPATLITTVKAHAGETVELSVDRAGSSFIVSVVPRQNPPPGEGALGVAVSNLEKHVYPWYSAPIYSIKINTVRSYQMISSIFNLLFRFVAGSKISDTEVAGPIGIAQVTGEAVKYGWDAVLEFAGILSLNLAVLNILPFPALDGGRLAFVVLEKFGKKARPDIERIIHQIGMMFLLALMALITIHDILRITRG